MSRSDRTELVAVLKERHGDASRFSVDLSEISRWKVGGPAMAVVEPRSVTELADVLALMNGRSEPIFIAGDMSNVLFDSRGFDGVVIRLGSKLSRVERQGSRLTAEAGIAVPRLARLTADYGLSGLEHTVGIPGTLGGLVTMNGGSQRKGIGLNVRWVDCMDGNGNRYSFTHEECKFGYRSSILQTLNMVVVSVDLDLTPADPSQVHEAMDAVVESRRSRFPEDLPNCGSTFLSDPAMYDKIGAPGHAIEAVGLKGYSRGGASISPQHANFVVNTGNATSDDILDVIRDVRETVSRATGFTMDCEVRFVSSDGRVVPAHEAADARDRFAA